MATYIDEKDWLAVSRLTTAEEYALAIKLLRKVTGCSLLVGKDIVFKHKASLKRLALHDIFVHYGARQEKVDKITDIMQALRDFNREWQHEWVPESTIRIEVKRIMDMVQELEDIGND